MKKYLGLGLICFSLADTISAQETTKLWSADEKPYYKKNDLKEYEEVSSYHVTVVSNITEPTLSIYPAEGTNSGKAVVIIPGGGYGVVALYHEGHDLAKILSAQGITVGVLKYRLPNPASSDQPELVPLADTRRALSMLRSRSKELGFASSSVGVMGFSAGSHLATVASLWKSEKQYENPNFSVLIYGVTEWTEANKQWLEESLYFRSLTPDEIAQNQLLEMVDEDTPPAFLAHAYDDKVCPVAESTLYAKKLFEASIPVEMHLFEIGGHGFGVGRVEDGTDQWVPLFVSWLKRSEF